MATGQVKLGDFIRIDLDANGKMTFVKEAEGALVPVLLERYGPWRMRKPRVPLAMNLDWNARERAGHTPAESGVWVTEQPSGVEEDLTSAASLH